MYVGRSLQYYNKWRSFLKEEGGLPKEKQIEKRLKMTKIRQTK